ncbi:MAG: Phosphoribosylformylglycinamidine synthase [Rhodocyclaceae bacterium]|nr:Phosphoribosylformylglycinamidine synthase [Rhodocyclaceae bacterium]
MRHIIALRGTTALSPARLSRTTAALRTVEPKLRTLAADEWFLVELDALPDEPELERLCQLISGRPDSDVGEGVLCLVTPRLGTISPWCSKATDIAHQCGFGGVRRIERAIAYRLDLPRQIANRLTGPAWSQLAGLLHDRMTESALDSLAAAKALFAEFEPAPVHTVLLSTQGPASLQAANRELGLALSDEEIAYLVGAYQAMERDPTDAELMMFAQANSEHCRHKIFNAHWIIEGQPQPHSLFEMIRSTHAAHPEYTLVAYEDNAAVIAGGEAAMFAPDEGDVWSYRTERLEILAKVETHNHPTAISPFAGAATGAGGEIRDEGATGRGAKPKAGLCGFSVSDLNVPDWPRPWETGYGSPDRISPALEIMLAGPIGAAAFNNEFGRPNLAGYFRSFELDFMGERRGYHKPIMIAGGIGNITARQINKIRFEAGALLVVLGGPAMRIGLGGGSASSISSGTNTTELDFASVQRGNPEMQRRAQEVIDGCWRRGSGNPILAIHDVGAGGLANALPELVHAVGLGARLELREVPTEEPGMSPMEIWCNEAQERYVLAVDPACLADFDALCKRERCPYAVLGVAAADGRLKVSDRHFGNRPVDMPLDVLLGRPPRMTRQVSRRPAYVPPFDVMDIDLAEAVARVLSHPSVASKEFLITIGDRTVGGLCARDQMVGPWQVPVADCAVTARDFRGYAGEGFAMGERTPLALLSSPAAARMAVGEALTNLAAADVPELKAVKLSANWMAAAGHKGEDAALFDAVHALAFDFCPALGVSIPVGKDSLSMRTAWQQDDCERAVIAPVSLIVTAFAPITDIRRTLTPQIKLPENEATELLLIDLGQGRNRLGGSILAQCYRSIGEHAPDIEPEPLARFFAAVRELAAQDMILAYHDRSDGGLLATLAEMAFAGRVGLSINLDTICWDPLLADVDSLEKRPDSIRGRYTDRIFATLFAEELGAVIQIRQSQRTQVMEQLRAFGLSGHTHFIGHPNERDEFRLIRNARVVYSAPRATLQKLWNETSYRLSRLRDDPTCADEAYAQADSAERRGLYAELDIRAPGPSIVGTARPRVAILREQGVNGQMEMAAAFERAGFAPLDVHMSDLKAGHVDLADFSGLAACGGFSYGDVLGAGTGWAKSILFDPRLREQFGQFFARPDSFTLGVCNGCQMLSQLAEIIPGSGHWPRFERNRSDQYEARLVMVEVAENPSVLFAGMSGSRLPIVVSHGEGRARFATDASSARVALRFIDGDGRPTEHYPDNPNGSPAGIASVCNDDGRITIMMPHPERLFRTVQFSWHPESWLHDWPEESPWMTLFHNARRWLG